MGRLRDRLIARVLLGIAQLYDFGLSGTLRSPYFVPVGERRTWSIEYALRQVAQRLAEKSERQATR